MPSERSVQVPVTGSQLAAFISQTRFENAIAVSAEELMFAMQLSIAAGLQKMPMESPSSKPIDVEWSDGNVESYILADSPQMRGMVAIIDHYHDDKAKGFAIQTRLWALCEILHHATIREWERGDDVHFAVYAAAADVRLTKQGKFRAKEFFKRVKQIADEHSSEELERKLMSHTG